MLNLEDITRVYQSASDVRGYFIEFRDGRKIHLTKRRTIIALLILIKFGVGSEADLAKGNTKIQLIKEALGDRIPDSFIKDYYGDANKPYSELWNEEGFTFITNSKRERTGLSQTYTLALKDHDRLFTIFKKANRRAPTENEKKIIRQQQKHKCNFCGSNISPEGLLNVITFAKDRRREVFDHRHPVEKGGDSNFENFQGLCFYCNKCKWQICNICDIPNCDPNCALRNPENSKVISPNKENISDVLAEREIFKN